MSTVTSSLGSGSWKADRWILACLAEWGLARSLLVSGESHEEIWWLHDRTLERLGIRGACYVWWWWWGGGETQGNIVGESAWKVDPQPSSSSGNLQETLPLLVQQGTWNAFWIVWTGNIASSVVLTHRYEGDEGVAFWEIWGWSTSLLTLNGEDFHPLFYCICRLLAAWLMYYWPESGDSSLGSWPNSDKSPIGAAIWMSPSAASDTLLNILGVESISPRLCSCTDTSQQHSSASFKNINGPQELPDI